MGAVAPGGGMPPPMDIFTGFREHSNLRPGTAVHSATAARQEASVSRPCLTDGHVVRWTGVKPSAFCGMVTAPSLRRQRLGSPLTGGPQHEGNPARCRPVCADADRSEMDLKGTSSTGPGGMPSPLGGCNTQWLSPPVVAGG